jgi:hypothetical protein
VAFGMFVVIGIVNIFPKKPREIWYNEQNENTGQEAALLVSQGRAGVRPR